MEPERSTASTARPLVLLSDITDGLVWPRLLRAGALAFNPTRLGLAFFAVLLLHGLTSLGDYFTTLFTSDSAGAFTDCARAYGEVIETTIEDPSRTPLVAAFYEIPIRLFGEYSVLSNIAFVVFGLLWLVVFAIAGVAICRSACAQYSQGVTTTWPEALGFSLKHAVAGVASLTVPMASIAGIALLLSVSGMVLLSIPGLNVLGGLLFGLGLVFAFLGVLAMVGLLLGWPLLLPAVACEATDAADSIQRAYSYVLGRPLRLVLYSAILVVQGIVLIAIVTLIAGSTLDFASSAAGQWTTDRGERSVSPSGFGSWRELDEIKADIERVEAINTESMDDESRQRVKDELADLRRERRIADPGMTYEAAHGLFETWVRILRWLVSAIGLSFLFCASTLLYLGIRRIHDGQDESEVWFPGMIEGSLAPIGPIAPERVPDADEPDQTPSSES